MAPYAAEADLSAAPAASPWWYRRRFLTIGCVYGAGFFFGNLLTGMLGGRPPEPAFIVWGKALGPDGHRVLLVAMVVAALAAWALRAWGGAYLRPEVVWNADALGDRLLVDGPFRFVRNPLYLGNVLLAAGVGLLAPPLGFALIVGGNIWIVLGLMQVETALLRARYGPAFDAYAAAVPALIPRLTPAPVAGAGRAAPSLALGLRSELYSAALALSLIAFAFARW